MKFKYDDEIIEDEDRLKEIVCQDVDEEYISDFVDYNYNEFCTNIDEFMPSEIISQMCGGFESYREDEDLFDYLVELSTSTYKGFDYPEDYEGETTMEIAGVEFDIIFEDGDLEEEEGEE